MSELEALVSGMLIATVIASFVIYNHYEFIKANEEISNDINKILDYENKLKKENPSRYYLSFLGRKLSYDLLKNSK